jgi:hypothetical protein
MRSKCGFLLFVIFCAAIFCVSIQVPANAEENIFASKTFLLYNMKFGKISSLDFISEDRVSVDLLSEDTVSTDTPGDDVASEDVPGDDVSSEDVPGDDVVSDDVISDDVTSGDVPPDPPSDLDILNDAAGCNTDTGTLIWGIAVFICWRSGILAGILKH